MFNDNSLIPSNQARSSKHCIYQVNQVDISITLHVLTVFLLDASTSKIAASLGKVPSKVRSIVFSTVDNVDVEISKRFCTIGRLSILTADKVPSLNTHVFIFWDRGSLHWGPDNKRSNYTPFGASLKKSSDCSIKKVSFKFFVKCVYAWW